MVSNRHYLPPPQGDEMSQIGLTVNQVGSKTRNTFSLWVDATKYPVKRIPIQNGRGYDQGFVKRFLEIDPDIVTGYNIMGFDFIHLQTRYRDIEGPRQHAGNGEDRTGS
jgi:DNA polymerase elongation subunit (family B)